MLDIRSSEEVRQNEVTGCSHDPSIGRLEMILGMYDPSRVSWRTRMLVPENVPKRSQKLSSRVDKRFKKRANLGMSCRSVDKYWKD